MVISAACDLRKNVLKIFDSTTDDTITLSFKDVNDKDGIKNFFDFLQSRFNHAIDYFLVRINLENDYNWTSIKIHHDNEFRKNFIETAQQYNIRNIKIVDEMELSLFNALETPPVNGELLWVFEYAKDIIWVMAFKYEETDGWEFLNILDTSIKNGQLTVENLRHFEQKLDDKDTLPLIVVFFEYEINRNLFTFVFSPYKKITFLPNWDSTNFITNYAKHFIKEDKTFLYKSNSFLTKTIEIKLLQNDIKLLIHVPLGQILPFKKNEVINVLPFNVLYSYTINVYENDMCSKRIPLTGGRKYHITLEIDTNGIYTVHVANAFDYDTPQNANNMSIPMRVFNYEFERNAIGIDLGTTECCAAVIRRNGPDFVVLDPVTGLRTMPSYVAFDETNDKCGQIVVDRMRHFAQYTVYDIKRIIGKTLQDVIIDPLWPFNVVEDNTKVKIEVNTSTGRMMKSPEEISAILIKHMKTCLDGFQGNVLKNAVITIPSEFSEAQIKATAAAAELAGWKNISFLPEPIAAAFAYFSEIDIPNNSNILICDCGGGTVDICIAKVSKNQIKILGHHGDPYLGGRDFDRLLFDYFEEKLRENHDIHVTNSNKKYVLKVKCQAIKHTLTAIQDTFLDVDDFENGNDEVIAITRDNFEIMAAHLLSRLRQIILQTLTNSNLGNDNINYAFQVGGGCRMPMIKNLLLNIFPHANHQCNINPDWVVAHGAALYAYHLNTSLQLLPTWKINLAKTIAFFNHGPSHPSVSHDPNASD